MAATCVSSRCLWMMVIGAQIAFAERIILAIEFVSKGQTPPLNTFYCLNFKLNSTNGLQFDGAEYLV